MKGLLIGILLGVVMIAFVLVMDARQGALDEQACEERNTQRLLDGDPANPPELEDC